MDHIWGAAKTWQERLPAVEMSVFQEELIARGLKEHADKADAMQVSVQFPIMYLAVLAGECVEQACNIFYILHRILYFLPEVRGEGTCSGGREERSVNHIA